MRYLFSALPWEMLDRPVMLTLTYPAQWRACAADARSVVRQREALKERWRRKWGAPVGAWVMEFQPRMRRPSEQRHAPHIHLYVGLPPAVSEEEYRGLVRRTLDRRRLERRYGKYEGRRRVRPPQGEFSEWVLRSWWEVVGSGEASHRRRGADLRPAFWSEQADTDANRTRIADYFWRESGKWGQKTPPEGFGGLAFYGRWGKREGFEPLQGVRELDQQIYVELRRLYRRLVEGQRREEWLAAGRKPRRPKRSRGLDGVTAFVRDGLDLGSRAEEWALGEAIRKSAGAERSEAEILAGGEG